MSPLKASCQYDLSFPLHQVASATDRLRLIHEFMDAKGLKAEYLAAGQAAEMLQNQLAGLFGFESALWFPTGTMAQGIAAKIHTSQQHNNRLLLHPTSHLLLHEESGFKHAYGLEAVIRGQWREPLSASDFEAGVGCVFVEVPQRHSGGAALSWKGMQSLKETCARLKLPLHMDGARIWSARKHFQNRSYAEIVSGFDSVYVSFYKDIGAMGGAVLLGSEVFIEEAKIWRSRLGGLMIEPWPMIVDVLRLLDQRLLQMPDFVERAGHLAKLLGEQLGCQISPNPPQTNQFHVLLPCSESVAEQARDQVATTTGVWLGSRFWGYEAADRCALEITVGENALAIPDAVFTVAMKQLTKMVQGK